MRAGVRIDILPVPRIPDSPENPARLANRLCIIRFRKINGRCFLCHGAALKVTICMIQLPPLLVAVAVLLPVLETVLSSAKLP